ncbi:hypothetical protein I3F55_32230, partial [Streptomyces sp. MUM 16J]|nr:hypothetical protein [Streptomyces sp. MUM 16J]
MRAIVMSAVGAAALGLGVLTAAPAGAAQVVADSPGQAASAVPSGQAVSAGSAGRAAAGGYWACSVPAGKTYSKVDRRLNACNSNGWGYSYYVVAPADNLWACTVPSGFTYDRADRRLNTCSAQGWG